MHVRCKKILIPFITSGVVLLMGVGCRTPEEIIRQQEANTPTTTQEIIIRQELEKDRRVITVIGKAEISAQPDLVIITFSIHAEGETAELAQQNYDALYQAVLSTCSETGVVASSIKSQNTLIIPVADAAKPDQEPTWYNADNIIVVPLRNVKRAGELLSKATLAGADAVLEVEFQLTNEQAVYDQALKQAVESANEKAKTVADAAGLVLQGPYTILEDEQVLANTPLIFTPTIAENGEAEVFELPQAVEININAQIKAEFLVNWSFNE